MPRQFDHGIVAFTNGLFEVIKASHLILGDSHSTLKMKKHSLIKSINEQDMIFIPHFTFKQEVPIISATKEDNNFGEC